VDTGAFLAALDRSDARHMAAKVQWEEMTGRGDMLVCHNYILIKTSAVISRRVGMDAVRIFEQDVVSTLRTIWVTREIHEAAAGAHLVAAGPDLSLVDCANFEVMRRTGDRMVFAFDCHFQDYGYERVP
jgi:predicted nucleic acid-binding protein